MEPAEKATRNNKILCNVFSFKDNAKIPTRENRQVMEVATRIVITSDNLNSSSSIIYSDPLF